MIRVALRHYGWLEPVLALLRHELAETAPNAKLCDSVARFLCNMTVDDWCRQALLELRVVPLLSAAETRVPTRQVQAYFARTIENLRIPVSHAVTRARAEHYGPSPRSSHVRTHSTPATWTPTHTYFTQEPERPATPMRVGEWMGGTSTLKSVTFGQGVHSMTPLNIRPVNSVIFAAPPALSADDGPPLQSSPLLDSAPVPISPPPTPTPVLPSPTRLSHRSSAPTLLRPEPNPQTPVLSDAPPEEAAEALAAPSHSLRYATQIMRG